MADNRTALPADTWTEVIGSAPSTYIELQNTGIWAIQVAVQGAAPTENRDGIVFGPGEGDRITSGLNKVFARPLNSGVAGEIATRSA